ncbi:MAG: hypothetical protein MUF78_06265 [Candidatus Edwardsbacteria bacterium]|nr:hypothetical protein [Candidatus Edwardsbacteria bacterium]
MTPLIAALAVMAGPCLAEIALTGGPSWLWSDARSGATGPGMSVSIRQCGAPIFGSDRLGFRLFYARMPYLSSSQCRERIHIGTASFHAGFHAEIGRFTLSLFPGVGLGLQKTWKDEFAPTDLVVFGGGDRWGDRIYAIAELSLSLQYPVTRHLFAGCELTERGYLNLLGRMIDRYSGPELVCGTSPSLVFGYR